MSRKQASAGLFELPLENAILEAAGIMRRAIDTYNPGVVIGLFSGGYDSLTACHLASQMPEFSGCVHINTEIGIELTRKYVRETCKRFRWRLREMRPPRPPFKDKRGNPWGKEGQTAYEAIIEKWGFPGPDGHTLIYNRLKERCIATLARESCPKQDVMLVTGVRRSESDRRMGFVEEIQRQGRRLWVAPIANWTGFDKQAYVNRLFDAGLPRNMVVELLCMSGECLCGAFAHPGEMDDLARLFPETAAYIRGLELKVREAGHSLCVWEAKPPRKKESETSKNGCGLCWSCEAKKQDAAS